jgi:hypothetical protein
MRFTMCKAILDVVYKSPPKNNIFAAMTVGSGLPRFARTDSLAELHQAIRSQ